MGKKVLNEIFLRKNLMIRCFITFMLFSLTVGTQAFAQADKKISINVQNTLVRVVLDQLQRETNLHFVYEETTIHPGQTMTLSYQNTSLPKVLQDFCKQTSLRYEIKRNLILLYPEKEVTGSDKKYTPVNISGTVVDENGDGLVGVSVFVPKSNNGTITDANGHFSIKAAPGEVLTFTFVGMADQMVKVTPATKAISVKLLPATSALSEVIVTGYQTLSKERVTGAFGLISSSKLETKLQPDLKSLLEGQAAGIVIDKKGNIEIRGVSTFNAEKTPLLVVDGYPIEGKLEDLNPDNIQNITVLKDGVAASIYGSRAANGVIVITTKRGQKGKAVVSYKGSFNVTLKPDLSKLNRASSSDYIDAEIDLFNQSPDSYDPLDEGNMSRVSYLLMQAHNNKITQDEAMAEINQLRQVNGLKQIEKYMFRNQLSHQHNVSISGGEDNYMYNVAANYNYKRGSFINTNEDRLILDFNNQWKPYKFLIIDLGANILYNRTNEPNTTYSALTGYSSGSDLQPYTAIVDENGKPCNVWGLSQYKVKTYQNTPGMKDWTYNPIEDVYKDAISTTNFSTRISGKLRLDIMKGLNIEVGGVWQRGNYQYKQLRQADSYAVRIAYNDATSKTNTVNHYLPDGAVINEKRNVSEDWTIRTQINYNRSFLNDKHRVTILAGNEVRRSTYDYNTMATRAGYNEVAGSFIPMNLKDFVGNVNYADMLFGSPWSPPLYDTFTNGEYTYRDNRFVSWYGNGSYEYNNKFIVSGSVRMDLTNFFGTDPKYRHKPLWSVGGTYKLANEEFFDVPWINRLNIRASYGINGNIALDEGPFLILEAGDYNQTTGGVSYKVASPPNNQLRWEKTKTTNIGLDLSFLDSRLNFSFDYYTKNSSDLLAKDAIDPTTGFASLTKNVGRIVNNGIEITVDADAIVTRNFKWNINYNFAYNHNKVKEYNVTRSYASSYTPSTGSVTVAGYPANSIWGYKFAGLNEEGATMIYNSKGDKILIGDAEIEDVYYQGSLRPKFDMSMTQSFSYKNWDLSFMLIAKLGHKYRKDAFSGSNYSNRHVGERWQKPGDEKTAIYPVLKSWNMDLFDFPYLDILVGNASYMKLRDVTLAYTFDRSLISKIHLNNARVYFQMRNLFRITAKGVDIDPEIAEVNETGYSGPTYDQGYTSLPLRPEFYIGLSFSF